MKREKFEKLDGIDILRNAVGYFNTCRESFNQRYTAEQLIKIYTAGVLGEWDVYPDQWTNQQVDAAINEGKSPKFESTSAGPIGLHALEVTDCYCRTCRDNRDRETEEE